ncbi:MAG TPA: TIGR02266 family protein [Anaeromyxobacter sp.]|nr:TIGR02266 family protein [Anaeromyxobacter sp.]
MPEHRENRQHGRAPIELKVDYKKLNSFFADYTKNISKGGTFIKTKKTLPIGTRFLFRLTVPGQQRPFELAGEVIHAAASGEDAGMGIRFVWSDEARRAEFESVVESLMQESLGPLVAQRLLHKQ